MLNKIAITVAALTFMLIVPEAVSRAYDNWLYPWLHPEMNIGEVMAIVRQNCEKYPDIYSNAAQRYAVCVRGH